MSNGGDCRTAPATPGLFIIHGGDCRTGPASPGLFNVIVNFFSSSFAEENDTFS